MRRGKRFWFFTLVVCVLAVCSMAMFGCGPTGGGETQHEEKAGIRLDRNSVELKVGGSITLVAEVTNSDAEVVWTSSDPAVAHVDGGIVTAFAVGETQIVATVEDASASATVTVTDQDVPVLSLGRDSVELVENGAVFTLTASLTYGGEPVEGEIVWGSEDPAVVTVADGVLTPVGVGKTTVTASTTYLGQQAEDRVEVTVVPPTHASLSRDTVTLNLVNEQDRTATVTASMMIKGETVADATYSIEVEGDAATAQVVGNEITVTAAKLGETTVTVTATKGDVTVTTQLSVTVERANIATDKRFAVNTHVGDVALDLPYDNASGIYVNDKLVSVTGKPLTLSAEWLALQQASSTVQAYVRLPDRNIVVTLELMDEMRNVQLQATITDSKATVSQAQDGADLTGFKAGEQVQVWNTAEGQSNWNGATLEATIGGSRGDMLGYDKWVFDIVYTGEGALGDQNGDWLFFILSYGNTSTVTFREGGASREGLNIYRQDGTELLTMPQRNVRYTVVVSLTDWVKSGQYVTLGHYTNDMVCYVGNNFTCSDKYFKEHVRGAFLDVTLGQESKELYVNESATLNATVQAGGTDEIDWTSSDETVATVANGVVTAHKKGTAVITAAIGDKTAQCTVTVKDKLEMSLDATQVTLYEAETKAIEALLKVNGASDPAATVTYESKDTGVASVALDGTITAVAAGTVRIVVTGTFDGATVEAFIDVTVLKATHVTVSETSVALYTRGDAGNEAMPTSATVTAQMYVDKVLETNATYSAEAVNADLVTVAVDGNVVTIATKGIKGTTTVTITATAGGGGTTLTAQVEVTVGHGTYTDDISLKATTQGGDQALDLTTLGTVLGFYDGETLVSADGAPSTLSGAWLATQESGKKKQLVARFEHFDAVINVLIDEMHGVTMGRLRDSWPTISPVQTGDGVPGFGADDTVQSWVNGDGGWAGTTAEAKFGGNRGDMAVYDWWIFDLVFTKEVTPDADGVWLWFYLCHGTSTVANITADGPSREGVHVYDQQGNELQGLPQPNTRYTVVVKLSGYAVNGQYIVVGHHTANMTAYIGNNITCLDAYYQEHFAPKFAGEVPVPQPVAAPMAADLPKSRQSADSVQA